MRSPLQASIPEPVSSDRATRSDQASRKLRRWSWLLLALLVIAMTALWAGIISVHYGKDIHLRDAPFIGFMLMKREIAGLQSSTARERAEVRNDRRIPGGKRPEILMKKAVALLLNRRQRGANCFGTGNIGGHQSVFTLECDQFRLRCAICIGHLPVNASQNDINGYDDAEDRANDDFGSLCHGFS